MGVSSRLGSGWEFSLLCTERWHRGTSLALWWQGSCWPWDPRERLSMGGWRLGSSQSHLAGDTSRDGAAPAVPGPRCPHGEGFLCLPHGDADGSPSLRAFPPLGHDPCGSDIPGGAVPAGQAFPAPRSRTSRLSDPPGSGPPPVVLPSFDLLPVIKFLSSGLTA